MKNSNSLSRYRTDQAKNLVSFLVGDVRYAVDIHRVREIVNPLPCVLLPHAPAEVVGVADHRGEVLPVVDLRIRFGLPPLSSTRRTKWIVVRGASGAHSCALVVDTVTDVFGASSSDQRGVPELGRGEIKRGICAVYSYQGELVFVVDPNIVTAKANEIDVSTIPPLGDSRP